MKIYDAKQDNQKGFLNRNVNSILFNYFIITLAHGLKPFFDFDWSAGLHYWKLGKFKGTDKMVMVVFFT